MCVCMGREGGVYMCVCLWMHAGLHVYIHCVEASGAGAMQVEFK